MSGELKSVRIEDVAKVVNGGTPKTKVADYWNGHHLWITPAEMGRLHSPYLCESKRKVTEAGLQNSSASLVPAHTVILSTRAPIGHLIINSVPMAFNQGCRGIVPGENIHYKYLYYFLGFSVDLLNDLGTGTTFKELAARKLKKVEVPLPPLPEQKNIVAILDEAFAGIDTAIASTEKNLANARELFESYLNSVFDNAPSNWIESQLSDIVSIKHGFAFRGQYFAANGQYIVLTPGSFFEHGGFRDQGAKTKYYTGDVPKEYILEEGDFLFAMTEQAAGLLGSSLIVPKPDTYLHNQRLGLVQVRDGFDWHNAFFFHHFNTVKFRAAVQLSASGVKVRHTSPTKLGEISVKFPRSRVDQESVADKLDELQRKSVRLQKIEKQKLTALTELKQSLLQKAFSGELTADQPVSSDSLKDEAVA